MRGRHFKHTSSTVTITSRFITLSENVNATDQRVINTERSRLDELELRTVSSTKSIPQMGKADQRSQTSGMGRVEILCSIKASTKYLAVGNSAEQNKAKYIFVR